MADKAAPETIRIEKLEGSERVFQDAVNAGDLNGLISLYDREAVFIPAPGQEARGSDAIQEAWSGLLSLGGRFELTTKSRHQVEDISLEMCDWKLQGTGPDGNPMALSGAAAVVHRRQLDGSWRLLIDNPFPFE